MEGCRIHAKPGSVTVSRNPSFSYSMIKRKEALGKLRTCDQYNDISQLSTCCSPLEVPESPLQALNFLSRTWSSTSSDFFRIFLLNNLAASPEEQGPENRGNDLEDEEREKHNSLSNNTGEAFERSLTPVSSGKLAELHTAKHKAFGSSWMRRSQKKAWIGWGILSTLSIGCKKKRNEQMRMNAALAVAHLASAVAGIVANCMLEPIDSGSMGMNLAPEDRDKKLSTVVASAAALVATVCAETAASAGANTAMVASTISTGLTTATCADMMALSATAATCLRGAAPLQLRTARESTHAPEDHKILANGAQLFVRMPEGRVHRRLVSICAKSDKLALRLGKKHIGGVITTNKAYKILGAMEDPNGGGFSVDDRGFYLMNLETSGGIIQLLFEDQKQCRIWKSIISHL